MKAVRRTNKSHINRGWVDLYTAVNPGTMVVAIVFDIVVSKLFGIGRNQQNGKSQSKYRKEESGFPKYSFHGSKLKIDKLWCLTHYPESQNYKSEQQVNAPSDGHTLVYNEAVEIVFANKKFKNEK